MTRTPDLDRGRPGWEAAVTLGLVTQVLQILLLRELLVLGQSSELVLGSGLAVWMLAWGTGCILRRPARQAGAHSVTAGRRVGAQDATELPAPTRGDGRACTATAAATTAGGGTGGAIRAGMDGSQGFSLVAAAGRQSLADRQDAVPAGGLWAGLLSLLGVGWLALLAGANAREILGLPGHAPLGALDTIAIATFVVAPPALLAGLLFAALTSGMPGALARRLYSLESCGSVAGAVLLSTPLWERPGIPGALIAVAAVGSLLAMRRGAAPPWDPNGDATRPARRTSCDVLTVPGPVPLPESLLAPAAAPAAGPVTAQVRCHPLRQRMVYPLAVFAVLALTVWVTSPLLDRPLERCVPGGRLMMRRELRAGSAAILCRQGQTDLWISGRFTVAWPSRQEREGLVAVAMLQHRAPWRVLLWGERACVMARPAMALGARHVTVLSDDPTLIDLQRKAFDGLTGELAAARTDVVEMELRSYLSASRHSFDVIVLDGPLPATALANRIRTAEALRLARDALDAGGVLALPLASASAGGTLPPAFRRRNLALMSTLLSVFDTVAVTPGDEEIWLARAPPAGAATGTPAGALSGAPGGALSGTPIGTLSDAPGGTPGGALSRPPRRAPLGTSWAPTSSPPTGSPSPDPLCVDAARLALRLSGRPGLAYLSPEQMEDLVPLLPTRRLNAFYATAPPRAVNTDAYPSGCFLTQDTLATATDEVQAAMRWTLLLAIVTMFVLAVRRLWAPDLQAGGDATPGACRTLAWLGLTAIAVQAAQLQLLMAFQTALGSLYRDLGLLVGLGLLGVAIGAALTHVPAGPASLARSRRWTALSAGALALCCTLVSGARTPLAATLGSSLASPMDSPLASSLASLLTSLPTSPIPLEIMLLSLSLLLGACSGRAYSLALPPLDPAGSFASRAYAADMLGSSIASAACASLVMPALGFAWTGCASAAIAILASLVPGHGESSGAGTDGS